MSAKDQPNTHPNNAPGVPMLFPPWLESVMIRYINPAIMPVARYLPTFGIVKHRGRASGKDYETVVSAFRKGPVLVIGLAHGKTNWVKNVLAAGEADVHLFRGDVHITNPRVLPAGTADADLPWIPRRLASRQGTFVADIEPKG